jgi:hypothetical protein
VTDSAVRADDATTFTQRREQRERAARQRRAEDYMARISTAPDPNTRLLRVSDFLRAIANSLTADNVERLADELTDLAQNWNMR